MSCQRIDIPGGFIVTCSRGRSVAPCSVPGCDRPHSALCDFRLADGRTCDAKLCASHRTKSWGKDIDYCPPHAKEKPRERGAEHRMPDVVKPLLKFAGAKNWCAADLGPVYRDHVAETGGYYVEPFLGGASLFLAARPPRAVVGDAMKDLVEFYEVVRDQPGELAWQLSALAINGVGPDNYYAVRDMRPETPLARAARFLFLARLGFNGLIRHNRKGENNVPYGDAVYRKSIVGRSARDAIESLFPNREKIQNVSDLLKTAEAIHSGDFSELVDRAEEGDLVVIDPPYDGTYDGYSGSGFGLSDQERLAACLNQAAARGAVVVAHNALTEKVRALYAGWCGLIEVDEKRSIAANGSRRERAPCVVMVSKNVPDGFLAAVWRALGDRAVVSVEP